MRFTGLMAWCALALGWVPPALAQPGGDDVIVRETVDVKEVVVDAVVTDRDDEPVENLRPDDFALRVDGKKVKVTSLLSGRDLRESVSGRVTVVVLLDERHLQPSHREAVLGEIAAALIEEMRRHPTWVSLASLGSRLEPLLPPTRDEARVEDAFARATTHMPPDSGLREQQRRVTHDVRDMLRGLSRSGSEYQFASAQTAGILNAVADYGAELARDTRSTLSGIGSLVDALSFVPGRKVVLLVSDGMPMQPLDVVSKTIYDRLAGGSKFYGGEEITARGSNNFLNDPQQRPTGGNRADFAGARIEQQDDGGALKFQQAVASFDCTPEIERLGALANTHRVTFYPLKPPVIDSSVSGLGEREGERGSVVVLSDMRAGLEGLARATGGLAFDSENGVEDFLRQANEDYAAYYALSFRPPEALRDTGVRELVLRVRQKKTRLRYRASYLPIDLEESLSSQAWGTILFGWQENLHGVEVDTRTGALVEDTQELDVMLSLPIGKMELVPLGDVASGLYRVVMQLQGEDGSRLEPAHMGFEVKVPAADLEQAKQQFYAVRTGLRLAPGRYQMAVGLWEENTGRSSFVIEEIVVGAEEESAA